MKRIIRICSECKKCFKMSSQQLKNRHFRKGDLICKECYRKISKGGKYLDFYPEEMKDILKDEIIEYSVVYPFFDKMGLSKKKVKFVCQECFRESIMRVSDMKHRKICGCKPICKKCSLKFATNSNEWRDSNSKAQYVAQNRPEVLERQRASQLKLMEKDPLYAEKRCSKSYISGKIKGFRFDSSWELYFIVFCWESKNVKSIEKYDGSIEYFDSSGKRRLYYPDFSVEYNDGKKRIIEIKGSKKYNNFHEKFNAARKKHGVNYIVYEERDLTELGIYFRRESYLREFYRKHYNDIVFFNNKKVEKFKERIAQWLK